MGVLGGYFLIMGPVLLASVATGGLMYGRLLRAVPWLALVAVAVSTAGAFQASRMMVEHGTISLMIGHLMFAWTWAFGGVGLVLVVLGMRHGGPGRFLPVGVVAAGLVYLASFYASLPPWSGPSVWAPLWLGPGLALIGLGVWLWWRGGLSGVRREPVERTSLVRSRVLAASVAVVLLVGTGGYLGATVEERVPPAQVQAHRLEPRPGSADPGRTPVSVWLNLRAGSDVNADRTPLLLWNGAEVPATWTVSEASNYGQIASENLVFAEVNDTFTVVFWDTRGREVSYTWTMGDRRPGPTPPPTPTVRPAT